MLAGRYDVLSAGGCEQPSPIVRVKVGGRPGIEEIVVGCPAVNLLMVLCGRAARDPAGVVVPLRVRVVLEPFRLGHYAKRSGRLSPCRHRVRTPVDEDAETRLREPLGQWAFQGCPQLRGVALISTGSRGRVVVRHGRAPKFAE